MHALRLVVVAVATVVMSYFAIYFYDQYRLDVRLAGAVACLLLTIFLAYLAVQHWRRRNARSVTPAKGGDVQVSDLIMQLHSVNETMEAMREMLDQRNEIIQAQTQQITDLVVRFDDRPQRPQPGVSG
jgi:hypothetical protein